jgi:hypothetical protein
MDKTTAPKSAIGFLIGWSAERQAQSAAVKVPAPLPGGLTSRVRCIIGDMECVPCCLIACLVIDSIASTKPSSAIARLHKRAIPTRPKSFNPSPHAGAWQQQPAISITKSRHSADVSGDRTIMMGLGLKRREFITFERTSVRGATQGSCVGAYWSQQWPPRFRAEVT